MPVHDELGTCKARLVPPKQPVVSILVEFIDTMPLTFTHFNHFTEPSGHVTRLIPSMPTKHGFFLVNVCNCLCSVLSVPFQQRHQYTAAAAGMSTQQGFIALMAKAQQSVLFVGVSANAVQRGLTEFKQVSDALCYA